MQSHPTISQPYPLKTRASGKSIAEIPSQALSRFRSQHSSCQSIHWAKVHALGAHAAETCFKHLGTLREGKRCSGFYLHIIHTVDNGSALVECTTRGRDPPITANRVFSRLYGVPYKTDQTMLSNCENSKRMASRVRSHSCATKIMRTSDKGGSVKTLSDRVLSGIGA